MTRKRLNVLAEAVARLRAAHGWSQEELAKEADVTRSWVKKLEAGQMQSPGTDRLVRVASALGAEPRQFLELAGVHLPEDTLAKQPEKFDPTIVQLAEDLQRLPPKIRHDTVQILKAYTILQRTLGTPAARKLLESLRRGEA